MRLLPAAVAIATLTAAVAVAAPRPSDRSCLLAWNAPSNVAGRARVVSLHPSRSALLLPGRVSTDAWSRGSGAMQSSGAPACSLWLVRGGRVEVVTGRWDDGRVRRWTFGRAFAAGPAPSGRNVRVLADGRVTKIYRR